MPSHLRDIALTSVSSVTLCTLLYKTFSLSIHISKEPNEQGELIEPFMSKDDFYVSENIYFSREGITFVYPPYTLGSYAEGEKELTLSFYENDLKSILTPEFQFLVKDTPE